MAVECIEHLGAEIRLDVAVDRNDLRDAEVLGEVRRTANVGGVAGHGAEGVRISLAPIESCSVGIAIGVQVGIVEGRAVEVACRQAVALLVELKSKGFLYAEFFTGCPETRLKRTLEFLPGMPVAPKMLSGCPLR